MINKYFVIVIITAVVVVIFILSSKILPYYAIHHPMANNPAQYEQFISDIYGLSNDPADITREFIFTPDGASLDTIYIKNKDRNKCIVYCHGTSGNISVRYEMIKFLYNFASVIVFDYRGYGRSTNTLIPSAKSMYIDGETILDYALNMGTKISLFGEHLGCDVALRLAETKKPIESIILNSPSDSIGSFVRRQSDWINYIISFCVDIVCKKQIGEVNPNIKVLIVQNSSQSKLYDQLAECYRNIKIVDVGGDFNSIEITDQYIYIMEELLG